MIVKEAPRLAFPYASQGDPMNGATALERSGREFRRRLADVEVSQWALPTPCDEWDVGALVNHVIGGNVRYVMMLDGRPADAIVTTRDDDWLSPDPLARFDNSLDRITTAFAAPGILGARVRHPRVGSVTAAELRVLRVNELTVHAWDLSRAIGTDDRLDEQVVAWLCERLEPLRSIFGASGAVAAPRADDPPTDDAQHRLLGLLGRVQ